MTIFNGIPILQDVQWWFEDFVDNIANLVWSGLSWVENMISSAWEHAVGGTWQILEEWTAPIGYPWNYVARVILAPAALIYNLFRPYWDWLASEVRKVAQAVWDILPPTLKKFLGFMKDMGRVIWDKLLAFFDDPIGTIQAGLNWVADNVWTFIQDSIRGFEAVGGWLHGAIYGFLADQSTWIHDRIKEANDFLGGTLDWLNGQMVIRDATMSALVGDQASDLEKYADTLLHGALSGVVEKLGQGLKDFLNYILTGITWIVGQIVGIMETVRGAVSEVLTPTLTAVIDSTTSSLMEGSPDPRVEDATSALSNQLMKRFTEIAPQHKSPPPSLAELLVASSGVIGLSMLTTFGLDSAATFLDLAHPAKMTGIVSMAGDILTSLNFGQMIGNLMYSNIYAGIVVPIRYRWMEFYTPMLPPRPDLVTMVVREVFEPEMVIEAPQIFRDNMKFHGFTETWSDRYWTMHFLPIGLSQAYQNLWRGLWGKTQFMHALHIADIHPMWREDIYAVAFRAPSVRELGYGFDTGEYSVADIVMYRMWGGLSRVDAEKAGRAMVAYRTEAEREALRREAIADFIAGLDDEAQLRSNLEAIGGRPDNINLWVSRAKYRAERDLTLDLVKVVISDFVKGWSTTDELRQDLIELGIVAVRRDVLIREAEARRLKYKREEAAEKHKLLSSAKISKARELGIIGDQEFVDRHVKANYEETDARLLLLIELTPRPVSPEEIDRRRLTIVSRLNRARRRWERSMARIESTIELLAGQISDADLTAEEALDVLDVQISIIDVDIPIVTEEKAAELAKRRLVLVQQRELLEARWKARILSLTRKHTETVEERALMEKLRDEELGEYEYELAALEAA